MAGFTLAVGESRRVPTGALYLSILFASGEFTVRAPELGGDLVGETNKQFKLPSINQVDFVNESDTPIDVKYESSNIESYVSGKGVVAVSNEVVVSRIVEAIQVTADATVENGKMSIFSPSNFAAIDDLVIPAGQLRKFASARSAVGRKVIIQLITDDSDLSIVRIGADATLSASKGIFLQGNLNAVAGYEFETETDVYIYNAGNKAAVVTGGEQWR